MKKPLTQERPPDPAHPRTRGRGAYTPGQKVIIWSLLIVAFVAALPLGAYLALKITERQQAQSFGSYPAAIAVTPIVRDPERREALFISQMIRRMSLDEELGQMLMGAFPGTTLSPDLQAMIVNNHLGAVILFGGNIKNRQQLQSLDNAMQASADIPLFISIDQEGGTVNRLLSIIGPRPSAEEIGATNDPNQAMQQGVSDGQILSELGINLDFAPVVDVQTVSDADSALATRMYGTTPDKVAAFAGAYLDGLQSQGVLGCLKHWPGLGSAIIDPHFNLPALDRSKANLDQIDFAPYRVLLAQGKVDMIMVTHELVTAYDSKMPASLSPIMVNQVLRHDLGYQGVIVTDSLHMGALSQRWTAAQAAVLAVIAGDDLLLAFQAFEIPGVLKALHAAIDSGQITKARIDLSVQRILALKIKYGLLTVPDTLPPG